MLGEAVECATVSPHLFILSYTQVQCFPFFRQLHPDFGISVTEFCHVMNITIYIAGSNQAWNSRHDIFCFSPTLLAGQDNNDANNGNVNSLLLEYGAAVGLRANLYTLSSQYRCIIVTFRASYRCCCSSSSA